MKHQPPQVAERFSSCMVGEVLISAITAAELEYGVVASGEEAERNRAAMDRFLREVPVAPFDAGAARVYGLVRLASQERRRDALDKLIAAHALALDLTLVQVLDGIETQPLLGHVERAFVQLAGERTGLGERWLAIHPPASVPASVLQAEELSQLREEMAILQDRFAALSGSIGPVLNRLGDDIEGIGAQLRELLVLQAQANKTARQASRDTPVDEATALASVQVAYRELQDLRFAIAQEMVQLESEFRFYHCIVYRELIVQALRQRVVRVEQLVELSRQTILQKTLRSGGDIDLAARLVDEQAQRFGERIQVILDRITYPMEAVSAADLLGREESAAH